jgi:hypothetical protein
MSGTRHGFFTVNILTKTHKFRELMSYLSCCALINTKKQEWFAT